MRYVRSYITEVARQAGMEDQLLPLNTRFFLKEDVKPDLLLKALKDALKLYPIFGFTLVEDGDAVYLADNDAPVSIYETDKIILPDGKRLNGYLFFVGYSGRMISISVAHSLSDGKGVSTFFGKVFERYEQLLNGNADEITGPAYDIALMYQQQPEVPAGDYQQYVPRSYEGKSVHLPYLSMEKPYWDFICRVDEAAFMEYVKKSGTSAMGAIAQITDKGIFKMYPDQGDYIRTIYVISSKEALGMEKAFTNQLTGGTIDISRDEVDDPECLKRVRADIKGQGSKENLLYSTLHPLPEDVNATMMAASYTCSYLRAPSEQVGIIEKHESVPLNASPLPKLDVRTYNGKMEFIVTGSKECEALYNAVKLGLEMAGLEILSEDRQIFDIENGELTVIVD